jgi:hypothetical protein
MSQSSADKKGVESKAQQGGLGRSVDQGSVSRPSSRRSSGATGVPSPSVTANDSKPVRVHVLGRACLLLQDRVGRETHIKEPG